MDDTSSRVLLHYAQAINTGRFAQFDFGPILNLGLYNQIQSPNYPLGNITSKDIYLFQGLNDKLADPLDARRLYRRIPGLFNLILFTFYLNWIYLWIWKDVKQFRINPWPLWTHLDCSQARYENKFQDVSILNILKSYN